MPLANAQHSVLVIVDVQPSFLKAIARADQVIHRTRFLVEAAHLLGVPVLATEQNADRMGGTEDSIAALLGHGAIDKMSFSCCGSEEFMVSLARTNRNQVVLCGIETHICVNQTAHHLRDTGREVILAADAISCRGEEAHQLGLSRMQNIGAALAHSESIVYEWMGTAAHPQFRSALEIVKRYAS